MPPRVQRPFYWGAATAAYQIEGAATRDGRGPSVWDAFCRIPGRTAAGETGDVACDHYTLWRDDVAMMRCLGLQAYRFSLAWPRILPGGRGRVNEAGLAFYDRLIDALLDAGIEPFVTLYHWDLPLALQFEMNGWLHDDLPHVFADYAELAFRRFGDRVHFWMTINEPWVITYAGYIAGAHPPGVRDPALGYRAGHNLLRAHAYAVERFRAQAPRDAKISFALNTSYSFPASEAPDDVAAAERALLHFGGWFGDPVFLGDYPAVMRQRLGPLLPEFSARDTKALRGSADFIALNYYTSEVVRHARGEGAMETAVVEQADAWKTEMGWPVRPDGFYALLRWLSDRYGGLPVYITENGAACPDAADARGRCDDADRIRYLREHVAAMQQAQRDGVDLRGYFVWSLMDNLEWSEGFAKRFGIVHCDRRTLKRTVKSSGYWYADMIARGGFVDAEDGALSANGATR